MMSLLCGQHGLFKASSGGESFTKGIMMANHFAGLTHFSGQDGGRRVEAEQEDTVVGFVDAEGQGDRGVEYDLKLISAPMLLSRVTIFNWNSSMQKDKILDELMVMTKVALKYREKSSTTKPFCYLAITFQNCREQEISDGEERRLAQLLDEEPMDDLEDDKGKESRNKTRKFLRVVGGTPKELQQVPHMLTCDLAKVPMLRHAFCVSRGISASPVQLMVKGDAAFCAEVAGAGLDELVAFEREGKHMAFFQGASL